MRTLRTLRLGYLGPRTLVAFLALSALGLVLFLAGLAYGDATAKGVSEIFGFWGAVLTVCLLLRWLIFFEIG